MKQGLTRREFLGKAGVVTGALWSGAAFAARKKDSRPNIILIMSDDVSPDLYGCYGNKDVHTPNLDRMAREGAYIKNATVSTALCSPSRARKRSASSSSS